MIQRLSLTLALAAVLPAVGFAVPQAGPPPEAEAPPEASEPAAPEEASRPREVRFGNSAFSFYGFARLDAIYEDSRTDSIQSPTFVRSEDPSAGPEDEDRLTLHPRLTRFGFDLAGPVLEPLDGVRDGEEAAVPNLQARLAWGRQLGAGRLEVGAWGHLAREEVTTPVAGETELESSSVGVDWSVPVGAGLTLRGELWTGQNLSDFRGGIGQGVNRARGEEIASRGGWAELGWKPGGRYSLYGGATADDPDDDDLAAGDRAENRTWYLVQRLDFHPALRLGLDFIHWTTDYIGLDEGEANRLDLYAVYTF
jgi:hypothetical protein